MKNNLFWQRIFIVLLITSTIQILFFYLSITPFGTHLVDSHQKKFIACSFAANWGSLGAILLFFSTLDYFIKQKFIKKFIPIFAITICSLYVFLFAIDCEIYRWMNCRFTWSFLKTYFMSVTDPQLFLSVYKGGAFSFSINLLIVFLTIGCLVFIFKKFAKEKSFDKISLALSLIMLLFTAGTLYYAFIHPIKEKKIALMIRPFYLHFIDDVLYSYRHSNIPENYELGIQVLGGDSSAKNPFYKHVAKEDSVIADFKKRDFEEKPDIIFITIESWRGWATDYRNEISCSKAPNLCKLSKEGMFFPYTYSAGTPSTEGLMGILAGIWSHPEKYFTSIPNLNLRTLPQILGDLGYNRIVMPSVNPNFDGMLPTFLAGFDTIAYSSQNSEDVELAQSFAKLYQNRPKDKPVFMDLLTITTHIPFKWPTSMGESPRTYDDRFEGLITYVDSAVGIILSAIKEDPRKNNTIIVVVGDHSKSTGTVHKRLDELLPAHSGRIWTNMILWGKGISENVIYDKPVSHVDIAPTLLELLKVKVSNNFVGYNLLDSAQTLNPRFALVQRGLSEIKHDGFLNVMIDDSLSAVRLLPEYLTEWDRKKIVSGFAGEAVAPMTQEDLIRTKQLRAAGLAYEYILNTNRIYPVKENDFE